VKPNALVDFLPREHPLYVPMDSVSKASKHRCRHVWEPLSELFLDPFARKLACAIVVRLKPYDKIILHMTRVCFAT
jgi:hypothetical protein